MRIYIGWDHREKAAFDVASKTARHYECETIPVYEDRLRAAGLLTRPVDRRGQMWDLNSNAPQSTDFAITRFFVPLLAHSGWCLFTDCDCVFLDDPKDLMYLTDQTKAVMVVQHPPFGSLDGTKMDNQIQTSYPRKLWSSVMLWNVDHPANKRLNLSMLNSWPGRDLHAFSWLHDDEIGSLPPEWNWLCGMQPKPEQPRIAHFTLGTPNMPGHENDAYASIWLEVSQR